MRIITLNVNGIRSAARKGLFDWLVAQNADVVCLQETKAQEHQLSDVCFRPDGWHCHYVDAFKKGYSGVAMYARAKPDKIIEGLGCEEFDPEARYLEMRFGKLSVVSLYLPSGTTSEVRQAAKFRFMDQFLPYLQKLRRSRREYIICGDWNIAHKTIDLKNWRSNQKNSGFLPEERAWLDVVFGEAGWIDAYRHLHPDTEGESYTWWSNRGQAWAKNVGWRLDYHVITPSLKDFIRSASIYKAQRFSDHAPLTIDYELTL
ncbi:MAG: exodeoxyribonuclease III [Gammaproteobacteria bacterium]